MTYGPDQRAQLNVQSNVGLRRTDCCGTFEARTGNHPVTYPTTGPFPLTPRARKQGQEVSGADCLRQVNSLQADCIQAPGRPPTKYLQWLSRAPSQTPCCLRYPSSSDRATACGHSISGTGTRRANEQIMGRMRCINSGAYLNAWVAEDKLSPTSIVAPVTQHWRALCQYLRCWIKHVNPEACYALRHRRRLS